MTTGVNQASLVGPAVVTSQGNSQGEREGRRRRLYLSYGEVQVGQEPGSRDTEDTI